MTQLIFREVQPLTHDRGQGTVDSGQGTGGRGEGSQENLSVYPADTICL